MTTINWNQFTLPASGPGPRPYVLVTPNGGSGTGNDGGDFGSKTSGTTTNGIQEALNQISSTGGTVYITGGTYSLSAGFAVTASNQVLIFEAGVTLQFTAAASPITDSALGSVWIGVAASYGYGSTYANFSHVRLYGNGCEINLSAVTNTATVFGLFQYGKNDGHSASPWLAGEDFLVDGFVMTNVPPGNPAWWIGVDQYTTLPISGTSNTSNGVLQKIRNVQMSRIYYVASSAASSNFNPMYIQGAWHAIAIEDCYFDLNALTGTNNCGGLFIRANAGDSEQIVVRRCYFRTAGGTQPYVVDIQGNASSITTTSTVCRQVYIEDCVFDSGLSAPLGGEIQITDTGGTQQGYVTDVEFRRCLFISCQVKLVNYGALFGYIRFIDCQSVSSGAFPGASVWLQGRFPMNNGSTSNFTSIPTPASGTAYTNVDAKEEIVAVVGGSATAIVWGTNTSGTPTGALDGSFRLRPGDAITISYPTSGAPAMYKYAV